jgi:alpha-tubulin suppressor-like RCC1 family protein
MGAVAAGQSRHSLFVDAKGALLVCGFERETGTLGLPREQVDHEDDDDCFRTELVPKPVPSMAGIRIRQVAAGSYCSLALSEAGRVYMWGEGSFGRLAADKEDRLVPTLIQQLSHHRMRPVSMSHLVCAAVTEDGLIFTWATVVPIHDEFEERQPMLWLGFDGVTFGDPWPPQCVTALEGERIGSIAVGDASHW